MRHFIRIFHELALFNILDRETLDQNKILVIEEHKRATNSETFMDGTLKLKKSRAVCSFHIHSPR